MGNISKITLPDNNTYDIRDAKKSGIYTVIGTQTASTGSWTGALHGVSALYDGLTIMYYLPYAPSGNATLNLTLDDGTTTGAVNCYYSTSRLTTHYGKGSNIVMTYYSAGSIKIDGTATTDNRWIANANYVDGNTKYSLGRNGESVTLTPTGGSAQSVTLSSLINGLGEGASPAQGNDYLVAQYAGGGTSTTSYHRRSVSNVVNSTVVKAALGTGSDTTKYLRNDGTWQVPSYPTVNNATLTIQKNGTNVQTFTANQGTNATANITVPTKTSELTNNSNFVTNDNATPYEAKLRWGGQNFTASYGCIDAAMVSDLNANRFSFLKSSGITIEYTRDGGSTWIDYGATDAQKTGLFNPGYNFVIGKADSTNKATANGTKYQLRVTINTANASIYTGLKKIIIYCSTSGSADCKCQISGTLKPATTYTNITDPISISGWSGYNVIQVNFTAGNSFGGQYNNIRFLFTADGGDTSYNGLVISQILGFGGVGWSCPSTMAKTGHLYSYDASQNATFPANLKMNSNKQVGYLTETPTSGKIVVTDGTAGGIKASSFTVPTIVTGTLTAGQTSITLSNSAIKTTSTFEFFTDKFGVVPTGATVSNGSIVLTFTAQSSNLGVKVQVT